MSSRNGAPRPKECTRKDPPERHRPSTRAELVSLWRRATHSSRQINVTDDKGETHTLTRWERRDGTPSLKQFARSSEAGQAGEDWRFNKRAHTQNPTLWLGATRKRKGDSNKTKSSAAPTKGK